MNETSESGAGLPQPYLVGCDLRGRVVWISQYTQSELGGADNLSNGFFLRLRSGASYRVWPVIELTDTLVIGAQAEWRTVIDNAGIEDRTVRNHRRLQRAEQELSALVKGRSTPDRGKVVRQMELERQRLGRELHTSVGQMLAAIRLQLDVVAAQIPAPGEAAQRALDAIGRLAGDALEQVRGISRRLHPPEWQRLTLEAALGQLWEVTGIPHRFETLLNIRPLPREPAHEVKVLLYRAAQEALANIARHSGATRVEMELEANDGAIVLTIRDDGRGFDLSAVAAAPVSIESGIGLRSIREEAADLGARLEIKSGAGGTTLSVMAPFAVHG